MEPAKNQPATTTEPSPGPPGWGAAALWTYAAVFAGAVLGGAAGSSTAGKFLWIVGPIVPGAFGALIGGRVADLMNLEDPLGSSISIIAGLLATFGVLRAMRGALRIEHGAGCIVQLVIGLAVGAQAFILARMMLE